MIGQHHPRLDVEWVEAANPAHGVAQEINVAGQQSSASFEQVYGEEKRTTRKKVSAIVGHESEWRIEFCEAYGGLR